MMQVQRGSVTHSLNQRFWDGRLLAELTGAQPGPAGRTLFLEVATKCKRATYEESPREPPSTSLPTSPRPRPGDFHSFLTSAIPKAECPQDGWHYIAGK